MDIGYVESKASSSGGDTCWTHNSYWEVGFQAGSRSGQIRSKWVGSGGLYNRILVGTSTYDSTICGVEVHCATKEVGWSGGTVGNVFFVVTPGATPKMKMVRREEIEALEC